VGSAGANAKLKTLGGYFIVGGYLIVVLSCFDIVYGVCGLEGACDFVMVR
jgi:hypothetical protein